MANIHVDEAVRGTNIIIFILLVSLLFRSRYTVTALCVLCESEWVSAYIWMHVCVRQKQLRLHTACDLHNWVCLFFARSLVSRFLFVLVCVQLRRCSSRCLRQSEFILSRRLLSINLAPIDCSIECVMVRAKKGKKANRYPSNQHNDDFIPTKYDLLLRIRCSSCRCSCCCMLFVLRFARYHSSVWSSNFGSRAVPCSKPMTVDIFVVVDCGRTCCWQNAKRQISKSQVTE